MNAIGQRPALILIDVQKAFNDVAWGNRNNPNAEQQIKALLAAWREKRLPVFHVRHASPHPEGLFREGQSSFEFKPEAEPWPGEPVYKKTVNSAFIGTSLECDLRANGIDTVVIVGFTTNHCVSTTARMSGNLGFATYVVEDATAAFDRKGLNGEMRPASEVHASALSDLRDEFATIVSSAEVMASISSLSPDMRGEIQQDAPSPAAQAYIDRIFGTLRGRDPQDVMGSTVRLIEDLVPRASTQALAARPAPGKWSANEILAHLADTEVVLSFRLRQILSQNGIAIASFDQDRWAEVSHYAETSASQSVRKLAANRASNVYLIAQLSPEQMAMYGIHAERGRETVIHLRRMWAGHDLNHLAQLQTLLA